MGRGKIQIRKIENPISRQVTFSKRRKGLLKKAHELSVLCEAQIGLIVFSEKGKMKEFCSDPPNSMSHIIERYCRANNIGIEDIDNKQQLCSEMVRLRQKNEQMEARVNWFTGQELAGLSMDDLNQIEDQLEISVDKVRARKNQLLQQQFVNLRRRAQLLEDENSQYHHALEQHQLQRAEATHHDAASEYKMGDGHMLEEIPPLYTCDSQRNPLQLSSQLQGFPLQPNLQELSLHHLGF